jgi:hypothetical protein
MKFLPLTILAALLCAAPPFAQAQHYISDIDKGDGQWGLVMSQGASPLEQVWTTSRYFPDAKVRAYWDKDYYISNLSYSGSVWVLVMSKGMSYTEQVYLLDPEFPEAEILAHAARGFLVSNMIFADGTWALVLSKSPAPAGGQMVFAEAEFPAERIRQYRSQGYFVTDLTYGQDRWGVVMTRVPAYRLQAHLLTEAFPEKEIDSYWSRGYRITSMTYGDGQWALVFTLGSAIEKQVWVTSPEFPREQIELYWSGEGRPLAQPAPRPLPQPPARPASARPRVWAVLVGISDYSADLNNTGTDDLRYSSNDARLVYNFLRSPEGGAVPSSQLALLTDAQATRHNVLNACRRLFSQAAENDLVIFYFSGHGFYNSFLAHDGSLFHKQLNDAVQSTPARRKLCVADACHSGAWDRSAPSAMKVSTPQQAVDLYYKTLDEAENGIALFMSSRRDETSLECGPCGMGLFTYYYLEGLRGAADSNGDSVISIGELYAYVSSKVNRHASIYFQHRQTPQLSGAYDADLPVGIRR